MTASEDGRAQFRLVMSRLKVWDIIGRSMVIHDATQQRKEAEDRYVMNLIDGLVHDCSISSALAMELLQSCTKPSIFWLSVSCVIDFINICMFIKPFTCDFILLLFYF